jgi:hypothetical protein
MAAKVLSGVEDHDLRAFGLRRGVTDDSGDQSEREENADFSDESEERDEPADASAQEDDGEESDAEDEDRGDDSGSHEEEGEDGDPEVNRLRENLAKKEDEIKAWQSRFDRNEAENRRMMERTWEAIQSLKHESNSEEPSYGLDDDDVVTGRTLKQMKAVEKSERDEQGAKQQLTNAQTSFIAQQAGHIDVVKYLNDKGLKNDPEFKEIPTDTVGYYYAAEARMLREKLQDQERSVKDSVAKAIAAERKKMTGRKPGSVPPTGNQGGGNTKRGSSRVPGDLSATESMFAGWMKQKGFTPQIVTRRKS